MQTVTFHVAGNEAKNANPFFTNRSRAKKGQSTTSFVSRNDFLTVFEIDYAEFKNNYLFDRKAWIYRKITEKPIQEFAKISVLNW